MIGPKAILLIVAASCALSIAEPASAQRWQPPPGAKIYREEQIVPAGDRTLRVVFYSHGWEASATVVSSNGQALATVKTDLNIGIRAPTGVYHLKNDSSWQIVLFGQVGAKAHEAKVYDFRDGKLVEVFDWSGWSFRIVRVDGNAMIAAQVYEHGSVADLYLWRDGRFQRVNEEFPSFYTATAKRE
jgi:hypothetical protein